MKLTHMFLVIVTALWPAIATLKTAEAESGKAEQAITRVSANPTAPPSIAKPTSPETMPSISNNGPSIYAFVERITGMEFLPVTGGCFQMGDNSGDTDEAPVHQVCLEDFFIGKFEVTQDQWLQIMEMHPSFFSSCGSNCPVENVSWYDVQKYILKLNSRSIRKYRLLTEAEWEYACRSGGKEERYCGGSDPDSSAWYDKNSASKPHPVGEKKPNGLGIYDMSGNVWEWVEDIYQKDYYSTTPLHSPKGPLAGTKRVIRGGSWYNDQKNVRASIRSSDEPGYNSINIGFRLACCVN